MILAVDIGNSSISLGVFKKEGHPEFISAVKTDFGRTRDQYAVDIKSVFDLYGYSMENLAGAIVSSVVPPITDQINYAIEKLTGIKPIVIGPGVKTGLNILTEIHGQLGSDIVAAAVAAIKEYSAPMIVIDMGTATTMSAIDAKGSLLGCTILPGVRMAMEALAEHTAQLPRISLGEPKRVIGKNTIDSMRSGILYGNAGMLTSMIEYMEDEMGPVKTVVATGGTAEMTLHLCKRDIIYDADLVMRGLYLIYKKNFEK